MNRLTTWFSTGLLALSLAVVAPVHAQQPLKIGFGMSLTGPLAVAGKRTGEAHAATDLQRLLRVHGSNDCEREGQEPRREPRRESVHSDHLLLRQNDAYTAFSALSINAFVRERRAQGASAIGARMRRLRSCW